MFASEEKIALFRKAEKIPNGVVEVCKLILLPLLLLFPFEQFRR